MSESRVCIIDYGSGNVTSVYNSLRANTENLIVSSEIADIENATHLVLPGVGAFRTAMEKILKIPTFRLIKHKILEDKIPFLGICVGMQVLAERGAEFGNCEGLGIVPGVVNKMEHAPRLPHIGWNELKIHQSSPLLEGIDSSIDFYFVNSYSVVVSDPQLNVASYEYGAEYCAVIQKDNIYGVQFHPEKSQKAGQKLLKNFLKIPSPNL